MSLLIPVSAHFGAHYSVCSDIREAINNFEKKLSPSQFEEFHRTPTGHFMGLKNLQFSGQIIHRMLLLLVEDQPDDEFWILRNGEIVKFTFNDWCRITGLPNTKRYPPLKDKELGQSSLCHKFLGGEVAKCTFKHVREKYVAAENTMDSKKMVWAYECFSELVEKNLAVQEGTSSCEILNWASKKFPKAVTLKETFFRELQQKKDSDADTVRAIRDLKKRMVGLEVKIDEIKKLLVEVVMNLNSSGRRRRSVRIQRKKRARTKAAEEDDEDLEEDDEIEEAAEEYEEETGADEDEDETRENKEKSMESEDDTEETGENEEENAIGENEDTEQIEDEHTAVEKSHNDSDEDRAEKEGTAEHVIYTLCITWITPRNDVHLFLDMCLCVYGAGTPRQHDYYP
ncbi:unnamed protein product [Cuscuta campestris]|uniref:DUF1985 domain-containing protein n=1 Tax=Cuscuta campestris TaxID=132261 RepID=A0A484NLA4_9ASTE|nr:unnamed protein product [Cuscuta campestris]